MSEMSPVQRRVAEALGDAAFEDCVAGLGFALVCVLATRAPSPLSTFDGLVTLMRSELADSLGRSALGPSREKANRWAHHQDVRKARQKPAAGRKVRPTRRRWRRKPRAVTHTTDKSRSRAKFGGTVAAPKRKAHSKGKTRSNRNANSRPPLRQAADNLPSGKGAIRSSARKAKPAVPVPRRREALANVGGFRVAPERVRPSYFPILRAYIQLLEEGKAPTYANIARIVGGHRNTIQQLFQRHPDLWGWLARHVEGSIGHYVPAVLLRHAHLAIQGSVESAKLYLSAMGVNGARGHLSEEGDGPEDSRYVTHVNILVPHPQLPNGGRMPVFGPQPATGLPAGVDLKDIPTVSVR